jgi:DNA polymerase-3 subunit beta
MKVTLLKEKLNEGLKVVERIIGKSLTLPILNNILISTEKNFLNLKATDLEIGINWWSFAKIEEEGKIVVPTRLLSDFINLLPEKQIELEKKDLILKISCDNYQTQIKGFLPEDFPIIPKIQETDTVLVDINSFCQGLEQVVGLATSSTTRPEISGVYFLFQKDLIIMAATDSFRLGEKKIFSETPLTQKEYSFILPQKTARELINIFGEKNGQLKIYFSPNQIMFEILMPETPHPQIQLVSRLIEGEFPNYQEIIPKKYETQIITSKNEFLNQIKLASLFSGKINEVKFTVNPKNQTIEIFSQNPETGEYKSSLPGKIKGQEITISFNWRFIIDGLLNIKSPEVIFELNGEDGPGVLKPEGDQSYIYIVMPIKAS